MSPYRLVQGRTPLLISLPHAGCFIPEDLQADLLPRALASEDTDWHLEAVYAPLAEQLGASLLVAQASRYVVDLNRPSEDRPMYAGVNNTALCPTTFFDGEPLYRPGRSPDVPVRVAAWWQPYHQALAGELARLKALHGHALLWDGHSIESEVPWLFPGRLPDLNLGSNAGASCAAPLREAVATVLAREATARAYTQVVDGRFKGGHITRHYGRPADGIHALQMEMVQATYMLEDKHHPTPRPLIAERVERLRPLLAALLTAYLEAAA